MILTLAWHRNAPWSGKDPVLPGTAELAQGDEVNGHADLEQPPHEILVAESTRGPIGMPGGVIHP